MKNIATLEIKIIPADAVLGGVRTLPIPSPPEDYIQQRDDESDADFLSRAAVVLEVLRHRHGLPNP